MTFVYIISFQTILWQTKITICSHIMWWLQNHFNIFLNTKHIKKKKNRDTKEFETKSQTLGNTLTTWELYTNRYCGCPLILPNFFHSSFLSWYSLCGSDGTDPTVTHTHHHRKWCRNNQWPKFSSFGSLRIFLLEVSKKIALYHQKFLNFLN